MAPVNQPIPISKISGIFLRIALLTAVMLGVAIPLNRLTGRDNFSDSVRPFLEKNCNGCHGNREEIKGDANLAEIRSAEQLRNNPDLIGNMIDVLDAKDMPPDSEPPIPDATRARIIQLLKMELGQAKPQPSTRPRIRRLNRFQYNYTVKDLFELRKNVFPLSEKLMTRRTPYLKEPRSGMPEVVHAASESRHPAPGLKNVQPFPKDLRAAHGFDNQSNQLTLSPLLLDAFLKLSVSIVESPEFNEQNVGIWDRFFRKPLVPKDKWPDVIRARLGPFLRRAFRRPVPEQTLDRYVKYVLARTRSGLCFPEAMKKAVSAALSSPLFLFRYHSSLANEREFELASNLSYFFWSSCPDEELLELAASGKLSDPKILRQTIDRMMADPKIERFLDSFPSQWMQLENVLAATPDPQRQRYFSLDKDYPASLHMLVEPLLLFDAVFVENRPVIELIQPEFSYRSQFLETWYHGKLGPPKIDTDSIQKQNQANDRRRSELESEIKDATNKLTSLVEPVRQQILAKRKHDNPDFEPVDLKPLAAWNFDGNLKASRGGLDLTAHGNVKFRDGQVILDKAYLLSRPIPVDLKAKTLEVWCRVANLDQRGGGVMGIQGQGDFFDTIVLGERKPRHWISGSNGFSRTDDFAGSFPEDDSTRLLHLVMVYHADGRTQLYRNGKAYGKPFKKSRATFPKNRSQVVFGLRHLPPGGNKFLQVEIDRASLYDRALTAEEVQAANQGRHGFVSDMELETAMTAEQLKQRQQLTQKIKSLNLELKKVPANLDPNRILRESQSRYDQLIRNRIRDSEYRRVPIKDRRFGGIITNAATMSMTSGPKRSHPIARGAWIIEVIFNDPPPPPPNDVPPLKDDGETKILTIRERFRAHRENPDCAGCHSRLDPLGFAMENFDLTGRWRDRYDNGRKVDMQGTLLKRYPFSNIVEFKQAITKEQDRFAAAFVAHLLRYALARELNAMDRLKIEGILRATAKDRYALKSLMRSVALTQLVPR